MALTLGLTGMDPATETSLKAAFTDANGRLGSAWQLMPAAAAEYVVVDMDSMYGPMSWLRLHASGKTVIGLTSAPRTQADLLLAQPFDAGSLFSLLSQIAPQPAAAVAPTSTTTEKSPATDLPPAAPPVDKTAKTPSLDEVPAAAGPSPVASETLDPVEPPGLAVAADVAPALPDDEPKTGPDAPADSEPSTFAEWLASGRLASQVKFERDGLALLVDTARNQYFGPSSLKPLAAHVTSQADADDFVSVPDWDSEIARIGASQPLTRLVWYAGLLSSQGRLTPGFDPKARYQLLKWPQTEREYPKHFRIATTMMKGPTTLPDIAEASGVSIAEVTDFVNASLATGFADIERLPEPAPEPQKSGGLFGRLRGR
ncbi:MULTISPECIES: hypothetical protein [unclassified Lysobacter]